MEKLSARIKALSPSATIAMNQMGKDLKDKGIKCATTYYKRAIDIFLNDNNYKWKEGK